MLRNFTARWRNEYLLKLRESSKSLIGGAETISVGDVVVLNNERTPCLLWKLTEVEELIQSSDKIVRSAKISVLNESSKKIVHLERPIQHLLPLEISNKPERHEVNEVNEVTEELEAENDKVPVIRPRRQAFIIGEL